MDALEKFMRIVKWGAIGFIIPIVVTPLSACLLVACGSAPARPELDDAALREKREAFVEENNAAYVADMDKIFARMELEFERAEDPADISYDVLVVHGGGASGAFTTGFLVGWGDVRDADCLLSSSCSR